MAANYDLAVVHGPPSPAVSGILQERLPGSYVHVYPSQLYTEHCGWGVRDIVNHVLGLLRKHKSVVVEDSCVRGGVRDCLLKITPKKLPACKTRILEVRPKHGLQQSLWERQFILAAGSQPQLILSDEQLHGWFEEQQGTGSPTERSASTGSKLKETVTVPLTAETNYKFEVPALLVQWECLVDSGGYLEGKMTEVCQHWIQNNPCGRVVILCDGTAVAKGHQTAVQQKSQIISCTRALANELSCPVYVLQVTSTLDAGDFSIPPNPGLLAFLQRRHCVHLHHRSTVYVYADIKHMKTAEKAGVRHIQVKKVLKNPQVMKTCHSATTSSVPQMLQQIRLVAESTTTATSPLPSIPLADRLETFTDQYVCVSHPRGLREFLFAQDIYQSERYQTQYAENATPVGEVGSRMEKVGSPMEKKEKLDTSQYHLDTCLSDDQATLREHISELAPRQIPSWMLRKKSSSIESEPTPATLEKSSSTSSVEGRGRSRHTVYIMTEKELLETAKDVLKQAGRDDLIETCILQSSEDRATKPAERGTGRGNKAPLSTVNVSKDSESTQIIGPTPDAVVELAQQKTSTSREADVKKVAAPSASLTDEDDGLTAPKKRRLSPTTGEAKGGKADGEQQLRSPQKSSQSTDLSSKQQKADRPTETVRKAPDLSVLDEIFF